MSTTTPVITEDTARHVLWHYGRPGGIQAGSFTENLIVTIDMADLPNRALIALGFPELVAAVALIKDDPHGVLRLQQIAGAA